MSELAKNANTNVMENYKKTDNIVSDMQSIINASQKQAFQAINVVLVASLRFSTQ